MKRYCPTKISLPGFNWHPFRLLSERGIVSCEKRAPTDVVTLTTCSALSSTTASAALQDRRHGQMTASCN